MFPTLHKVIKLIGLKKHDCHPELPRDKEFHGLGLAGGAISLEEALFLAGVMAIVKPDFVLELGTANGASAVAIGAILKDLGKGRVVTVDKGQLPMRAASIVQELELPVIFIPGTLSFQYIEEMPIINGIQYMIFSDTDIPIRPKEVAMVMDRFPVGTTVVVHDTSDKHPFGPMKLKENLRRESGRDLDIVELPSPRGISVLRI